MKLLCVADQIDPHIYSSSIKEQFGDVDAVISAGDLPSEYLDFIAEALNKPVFFVFGNHNIKSPKLYREGAVYVGSRCVKAEKMLIAGVSGSRKYNGGPCQYTERQMLFKLLRLVPRLLLNRLRCGRFLDVFVTHAAPLGIHDREDTGHKGFKCFLTFMRIFKPKFLVHGHIHLYNSQEERVTQFEKTTVINAYSHYVIETEAFQ